MDYFQNIIVMVNSALMQGRQFLFATNHAFWGKHNENLRLLSFNQVSRISQFNNLSVMLAGGSLGTSRCYFHPLDWRGHSGRATIRNHDL